MKVYNYDRDTKEFTGVSDARLSPLEEGVHLIPAYSTTTEVIAEKDKFTRVFKDDAWSYEAIPEPDPIWKQLGYESEAAYDAKAYARSRTSEYPSVEEQLDNIYHNGIEAWKVSIKTTKDKYPKP